MSKRVLKWINLRRTTWAACASSNRGTKWIVWAALKRQLGALEHLQRQPTWKETWGRNTIEARMIRPYTIWTWKRQSQAVPSQRKCRLWVLITCFLAMRVSDSRVSKTTRNCWPTKPNTCCRPTSGVTGSSQGSLSRISTEWWTIRAFQLKLGSTTLSQLTSMVSRTPKWRKNSGTSQKCAQILARAIT